jgi:hypothetical protein
MPTSEAQQKANKKWRENNHEKYNAICRESVRKRYIEHKDSISNYKKSWYLFRKESEILRNILI